MFPDWNKATNGSCGKVVNSVFVLIFSLLFMSITNESKGQIYLNQFTGTAACPTQGNTPVMAANASGAALTRSTITCNSTANVFNSTTINNTSAISNTSYIEFSATATSGYQLNLTTLSFFRQASASAPNQLEVRYSTDGFATSTTWGAAPLSTASGTVATWDFADFSTAAGGTVTFRFYPYGTQRADLTGASASTGTFRLDDVTLNGTVTAVSTPTLSIGTLSPAGSFSTFVGTPSSIKTFTLSGVNLSSNLTVSAVAGYEYSIDGFATAGQSSLTFSTASVSNTVSVRLTGATIGTYNGTINIVSTGASGSPATISLTGAVNAIVPIITVGSLTPGTSFSTGLGSPSAAQTFTLSGANLSANLTVSAVTGYEYSIDGFATAGQSSLTFSTVSVSNTVSVRLTGASAGTFNGTINIVSTGATNSPATIALTGTVTVQPSITEVILPQYMQGVNGTNSNRIPYACYLTINNLTAGATYNYFPAVVIGSDASTSNGAGNCIFVNAGGFTRSTGGSLASAGNYGTFTANGGGSYSGWFVIEPTGNATRFVPGTNVFIRINLNDGAGGTTVVSRPTTANSATVLNLVAAAGATNGTGLRGNSLATAKNFVVTYDNVAGTGRPISASFIESDGTANTVANSYSAFYGNNVEAVAGAYGVVIPNTNANGIRRIEQHDITTGSIVGCVATDADGIWTGGANTVNPTGGTTALVITSSDAPLMNLTPSLSVVASPSTTICAGTNVTFTATPTNGGITPSYQWKLNGNNVGTNSTSYSNNGLTSGDIITCDLTSSDVCASPTTSTSTAIIMIVNANASPVITGTFLFCSGGSTTLDAGAGYTSYLWNTGETTQTINVTTAATFTVTVSNGSCNGTSSPITTTVLNTPAQPSSFTAGSGYVSLGQSGVVYSVPNDATATSYNWSYSGTGATINGSTNSVTVNFSGAATAGTMSVTATNSCGTSSALTMSVGINPPSFGAGNLVVLQTSTTVSKSSSPITLKEITPAGVSGITVAIPSTSTSNSPFQTSGIYGGSEGFLSTSADGRLLMLGGYATSATFADITATTAAAVTRAVGTVNQSGFFSQVATSNTLYSGNDIRGAVSDGTNYWASGASVASVDGIDYFGPGAPAGLATGATPPKAYGLRIFNGNIYYATQKAGPNNLVSNLGIFQLGTGLPTSGTQTVSQVIGTGATVLPQDFSFNAAGDVCYIASGLLTANGGVRKYTKSGGVWAYQYTLGTAAQGAYGLIVDYSGANPIVYATTLEAGGNKVIKITDIGAGSAVTVLVPVVANVYNKGISFAPVDAGTPTVNLNISTNSGTEAGATAITVTAVASSPVSSTQTVALGVSGTGITAGDYTLTNTTITIPAGATTGTVTFTVVDDVIFETTEIAALTIGSPSAGIVLGATTSQNITILDNDNTAPTISVNVATTSDLVDGGVLVSPVSPYTFTGTIGDATDPASTLGFDFVIFDNETAASALTVSATSSNSAVVTNANLVLSGTGAIRNLRITPTGVGYSTITIGVSDGINTANYVIAYAASNRTPDITPANTFWHTGMSDASDGIAIDNNYYMTGDDEFSYVNVYSRTASGAPAVSFDAGPYCALPDPGHPEIDIEAAARSTTNSNKMYWAGSMSNGASPFPAKPNRDRIFATTITGTGTSTTITFAGWAAVKNALLAWGDANGYSFTASAAVGVDSKSPSGYALEGMTFGPDNTTLYLGLRAPLVPTSTRTNAVIAPLLNFETWFNNGNPSGNPTFGAPIELNLNMRGIREIQRLSNGTYVIIAGDPSEGLPSDLYKWTGYSSDAPVLVSSAASGVLKMEGFIQVNNGANIDLTKLDVLTDGGDIVLYNDGTAAKDFGSPLRKFRSDVLTGLDLNICTGYAATLTSSGSTTFCTGDSVTLNATAGNNTNNTYLWSTGATTQTITASTSGSYSVTVTNTHSGCTATSSQTVTVNPLPTVGVSVTPSATVCAGTSVTLSGTGATSYSWTGGVTNGVAFVPSGTTTFTVTGTTTGCSNTATQTITVNAIPAQPAAFTAKTTFVYKGDNGIVYTVPNQSGVNYSWTYGGTGATINGSTNSVTINYSSVATSGTLGITANSNGCASAARTLAIVTNDPIVVPTANFDYSFVTVGCNRVDYLDTAFTTGDPDYSTGKSTANVYQLKRLFTEIAHLNPLPHFLIMTGDIIMGYKTPSQADTLELAKQLTAWRAIYESSPLYNSGITLIALPGNHETQDKLAGKHTFLAAEQIFTRIMAPYIHGSNGPGIGGPDGLASDQSKLTYSFDYGGDHYLMIDTDPKGQDNITPYHWIANDVQTARANHARHIFAFGHKPAYSSPITPAGGLDAPATLNQRDSLWKYLENNNVEAMFSAHEHLWDSIHPHTGKTWQVINGDGGTRVEVPWVGAGQKYYGYTIVNMYTNRTVNVMGVGRNTDMSTTVGTAYPINEDAYPSTVRNNFNICLTTHSSTSATACASYTWNGTTYTSSGIYSYTTTNAAGCDSIVSLNLTIHSLPVVTASNVSVCAGSSIALSGTPAGGTFSVANPYTGPSTTYTYTYTDGNGCNNTSAPATITVNSLPDATISASNGLALTCTNPNTVLSVPTPGGTSQVWNQNGSFFATASNPLVTVGATYDVTVTNTASGCTATSSVTTTLNNTTPDATISSSNGLTFCAGNSTILSVPVTGTTSQVWNQNGVFFATVSNPLVTIGATYSVTVTDATNGCTASSSVTTVANPLPIGSASNIVICNGDPSNVSLNSTESGSTFTWTSSVITGGVIGNNNCNATCGNSISDVLTNTGNVHGIVEYTVTPTSGVGCIGAPFTVDVTVGAAPAAPVISGPNALCGLTSTVYTVVAVPEATSYVWTVPTGVTGMTITSGQGTTSLHVSISAGTVSGDVTCTAINNCGSSTTTTYAVTKKPAVPGAITGPTSTCGQSTATYSVAPVFGATSYIWTLPAGITAAGATNLNSITVNIAGTFVYGQLKVSAVNACGNVPGTGIWITGNTPTTPLTLSGPANVCGLTSGTYSIPAVAGASGYNWTITGTGNSISGSNTGITATALLAGPGTISVAATNLCGSGTARSLNLVTTALQPGTITGPLNTCGLTSATYSVAPVANAATYTWSLAYGMTWGTGQGTNVISVNIPASVGTITATSVLKLTETNTCGNTSLFRSTTITRCLSPDALNTDGANSFSNIYPNPTTSEFTMDVTVDKDQEIVLEVFDILGNVVISEKHTLASGTSTMKTNIEPFNNGMYFVRILDANSNVMHTQRVVKQ